MDKIPSTGVRVDPELKARAVAKHGDFTTAVRVSLLRDLDGPEVVPPSVVQCPVADVYNAGGKDEDSTFLVGAIGLVVGAVACFLLMSFRRVPPTVVR